MLINDPDKRIVWKSRYDAWEASGLSAAEWCRNEDIDKRQMYCWIRKFRVETVSKPHSPSDMKWLTVNVQPEFDSK